MSSSQVNQSFAAAESPTRTVRLSSENSREMLMLQTPAASGFWRGYRFLVNETTGGRDYDYWVVHGNINEAEAGYHPPGGTLFVTGEPPSVKRYQGSFLRQFDLVLTCDRELHHRRVVLSHQGLPWHVGRRQKDSFNLGFSKGYDYFKALGSIRKVKGISVISSDKVITAGHRLRLEFVRKLKQYFGSEIDVFGRGLSEVEDKWDAIAPYRYHVTIENCEYPDYWTEKLADAFLGGAYPLYFGCPNIHSYFSPQALTRIDISDFESARALLKRCLEQDIDESTISELARARELVLDRYNLFNLIVETIEAHLPLGSTFGRRCVLRPEYAFSQKVKRVKRSVKRWLKL